MSPFRCILIVAFAAPLLAPDARADGPARSRRAHVETPVEVLATANDAARQRPTRDGFIEARHVYAYAPGAIYELYASPSYISTILLEPGETLSNTAAGDTSRWMVTQAESETQGEGRTIVLVKPQIAGLHTNVVLITDRRTYLIEAISEQGSSYSAQIAWSYPHDGERTPQSPIDALNFNYRIQTSRGRTPIWSPLRIFDDGRRTWIEFDPNVAAADMPPLFVVTPEGAELVNYRVQGQRYMLDRVFDVAELRLGAHAQTIVRIERNPVDVHPQRRWSSHP